MLKCFATSGKRTGDQFALLIVCIFPVVVFFAVRTFDHVERFLALVTGYFDAVIISG